MTSNENDLTARIRRRTETEDREMNELAARELQTFGETLRERVRHKLRTVETVMETEIARFVVTCLTVENSPESQEFVKNAPRAALSGPRSRERLATWKRGRPDRVRPIRALRTGVLAQA